MVKMAKDQLSVLLNAYSYLITYYLELIYNICDWICDNPTFWIIFIVSMHTWNSTTLNTGNINPLGSITTFVVKIFHKAMQIYMYIHVHASFQPIFNTYYFRYTDNLKTRNLYKLFMGYTCNYHIIIWTLAIIIQNI